MNEQLPLFDETPAEVEPWYVRKPVSPTDRKRAKLWRGEHPLSGVASTGHLTLHPDETLTCGSCVFFERHQAQGEGVWPEPKCTWGATRNAEGRITAAPRYLVPIPGRWYIAALEDLDSDLCEWFRACKSYQSREVPAHG